MTSNGSSPCRRDPTVRIRIMMLQWLGASTAGGWSPRGPGGALVVMLVLMSACTDQQPTEPSRHPGPVRQSGTSVAVFRDDFTDVDSTLLENHTPDGGTEPFSWIKVWGETASILDSALTTSGAGTWVYRTSTPTGDWAEVTVDVGNATANPQVIAIYLRTDPVWGYA